MDNITPLNTDLCGITDCDLLWVRSEGYLGGFKPKEIPIYANGYQFLLVWHNHAKGYTYTILLNDPYCPYVQVVDGGLQHFRVVTILEDSIVFSGVYTGEIRNDTLNTESVSYAMPYRIYGIR